MAVAHLEVTSIPSSLGLMARECQTRGGSCVGVTFSTFGDCNTAFVPPPPRPPPATATTRSPITTRHTLQPRVKRDSRRRPCVAGRAKGERPFVYSACTPPRLAPPRLIPHAPSFLIFSPFPLFLSLPCETRARIWATRVQTPAPIFITISSIVINDLLIVKTQPGLPRQPHTQRPSLFYNVFISFLFPALVTVAGM